MIRCRRGSAGDPLAVAPLTTLLEEVQAQQMGARSHLGTASRPTQWAEEHVGRMRRWSATQPDHLKGLLLPAEDIESWLQSPSGSWSCSTRIPADCTVSSGRWWRETALHP